MLQGSRLNPKLSAWDQLIEVYNCNCTPIGPPGTRVRVHDKPQQRGTWIPHGIDAWYIGPAFDHYRCYTIWAWETRRERKTDALKWFPHDHVKMPTPSALDRIAAGIRDIATALKNPTDGSPMSPLETSEVAAIDDSLLVVTAKMPGHEPLLPNKDSAHAKDNDPAHDTPGVTPSSLDATPLRSADPIRNSTPSFCATSEGGNTGDITYRAATMRKSR